MTNFYIYLLNSSSKFKCIQSKKKLLVEATESRHLFMSHAHTCRYRCTEPLLKTITSNLFPPPLTVSQVCVSKSMHPVASVCTCACGHPCFQGTGVSGAGTGSFIHMVTIPEGTSSCRFSSAPTLIHKHAHRGLGCLANTFRKMSTQSCTHRSAVLSHLNIFSLNVRH